MKEKEKIQLTTQAGVPVADNQNILTAGERGPALLQNVWYMEKLGHFNRERIPERVVHAKGSGAYGNLTVTEDITRYTKAALFSEVGKKNRSFPSLFYCCRRTRCGRYRTGCTWICC